MSGGQASLVKVIRRLEDTRTGFQKAELVETAEFGRALVLDGTLQSAEADEWIYHESLVHPALCACPAEGQVAILGGGEGATLREVLRHRWVRRAVMVDIDGEVVEFCKKHLGSFHAGAFDDPRAEIVIGDARAWLERQPAGSLSAIIFDLSEPSEEGPSRMLFTREFFGFASRALVAGGALGMHAGPAMTTAEGVGALFPRLMATLKSVFGKVRPLVAHVHSFSDLWTFAVARAGSEPLPAADRIDALLAERIDGELAHYDAECHRHMANLRRYLRAQLAQPFEPYTDALPPIL